MLLEKLQDARVLVLGGAGFLGARMVRKLCLAGISTHILIRSTNRISRIKDIAQFCQIHTGDLTDIDSLKNILKEVRPDVIMHTVGHGSHKGQDHRHEIFSSNVLATHNLLIATESLPDCRIIYAGTSLELGIKTKPLQEEGVPDPISFYGATKTAALILMRQAARYERRKITILRPFAIYGPGEPSSRLIPTVIRAALERKPLSLTEPGFVRDYVFVDDVADAYLMAAVNDKINGETINIAGGIAVSNEEVVTLIEAELNLSIDKQIGAYPAQRTDTNFWCADISKAKSLMEWQPEYSLQQGIKKTIQWFKNNGFND